MRQQQRTRDDESRLGKHMTPLCEFSDIYLYRKSIDFRKQINGLSVLVLEELNVSLCDNSLFVFINRHQNRIKLLYWDKTGFALWEQLKLFLHRKYSSNA